MAFFRTFFLLFFAIFFSFKSYSQVQEYINYKNNGLLFDIVDLKMNSQALNNFSILRSNINISEKKIYDSLAKQGPFFACSAALVDSNCLPIGLFVKNGSMIQTLNQQTGFGNFYLQPNGFFWVDSTGSGITETNAFNSNQLLKIGVQSGPMLVHKGAINTNFDFNSKNQNIRLGVGSYTKAGDAHFVFILSRDKVSFYDFALLFLQKFNCKEALSLDGGNSATFHAPSATVQYSSNKFPCNYIYFKVK